MIDAFGHTSPDSRSITQSIQEKSSECSGMADTQTNIVDLHTRLDTDVCLYCEAEDAFGRDTYKGTPAVVCEECGTPVLRVW